MKLYNELAKELGISLETLRRIVFRPEFERFRTKKKCFYTRERNGKKQIFSRYVQALYTGKEFYKLFYEKLKGKNYERTL